jgi:hypothetical protein
MKDLLVCVAHHSAPDRLPYLRQVLNGLSEYELECYTIIDTNVAGLDVRGQNITTVHHASLEHPFFLCWQHRKHFKERLDDYRWFFYIEDDIHLPWENFAHYQRNFELLWPDYVPSFIRVEEFEGEEYALDVTERQPGVLIDSKFCTLKQPYHGFWIMPQWALKQTMRGDFVRLSDSREIAASYVIWELNKTPLVELDGKQISRKCFAYHLPNNYAPCKTSPHAKIRVADIFL